MKDILLVTIQGLYNYGNRLQNYALQTVLEAQGCRVDNLSVVRMNVTGSEGLRCFVKRTLVKLGMERHRYGAALAARNHSMAKFSRKYIHRYVFLDRDAVDAYDFSRYDAAVTGSDQVWHNWHRMARELPYYYLAFMEEKKRVAYAASFGFEEFPPEDVEEHRKGLTGMAALSCREREGCELVRELTGRTAEEVLDPTLLLKAEDWIAIEKKPRWPVPERYLLQFMLGGMAPEYQAEIAGIAKARGLAVVDFNRTRDSRLYGTSPAEFIWLIHHADTVCTDSYHATVFTTIFAGNLRVFERKSAKLGKMFGRLRDLLTLLDLTGNIFGVGEKLSTELDADALNRLGEERDKSIRYLRRSLGLGEG